MDDLCLWWDPCKAVYRTATRRGAGERESERLTCLTVAGDSEPNGSCAEAEAFVGPDLPA